MNRTIQSRRQAKGMFILCINGRHFPRTAFKSQVIHMQTLSSLSWINSKMQTLAKSMMATCLITIVGACGGGGTNTPSCSTFTVGGAVTGLIAPFQLSLRDKSRALPSVKAVNFA